MIRSIVFVSVGLIGCLPVFAKMSAEPGFETVPLRHVMYLHLQGASNDAYTQALVYERKYEAAPVEPDENSQSQQQSPQHQSSQRQSIRVTRAGLAIDLGWYGLVESILAGTVSEQLAPVERDLLHFHLGRKAYRTQDWQQFEDEMASIESESTVLLTP
jgi:hypothetical protein